MFDRPKSTVGCSANGIIIIIIIIIIIRFYQWSLLVFMLMLLFSEGQAGEAWEVSNKVALFRHGGSSV